MRSQLGDQLAILKGEIATKNTEIDQLKKSLIEKNDENERNLASVASEQAAMKQLQQDHQKQIEKMNADQ